MSTPNTIAVLNEAIGKIRKQSGLTEQDQEIIDQLEGMTLAMGSSLKLAKPRVPGSTGDPVNSGLTRPLAGSTQGTAKLQDHTRVVQAPKSSRRPIPQFETPEDKSSRTLIKRRAERGGDRRNSKWVL